MLAGAHAVAGVAWLAGSWPSMLMVSMSGLPAIVAMRRIQYNGGSGHLWQPASAALWYQCVFQCVINEMWLQLM